ncbi:MAG TPA: tetratricopeptide repeat protein, partial [Verrucomicrobiae bacterium]
EVLRETGDRLEKHGYALATENGYEKHDRFPVLDAAWPTVAAALPRFLAGKNKRLQTVCNALRAFLDFTGRWDERLALSRDAENRAVAAGDFNKAGWRAHDAGWVHYLRGQSAEVLACAKRAEAHWREAKAGADEQANAFHIWGLGHKLAKDYPAAIAAFRQAVDLGRTLNRESVGVANGLNALAGAEHLSGDLDAAERDYREALQIAHALNYRHGIAICIGNLAELALERGDWPGAEVLAREALTLCQKLGRLELIAGNFHRLAQALLQQGKKEEALPHARRAVELCQKLGSPQLAESQNLLAECENQQ